MTTVIRSVRFLRISSAYYAPRLKFAAGYARSNRRGVSLAVGGRTITKGLSDTADPLKDGAHPMHRFRPLGSL